MEIDIFGHFKDGTHILLDQMEIRVNCWTHYDGLWEMTFALEGKVYYLANRSLDALFRDLTEGKGEFIITETT